MWGGRFHTKTASILQEINNSISFDQRLAKEDIFASRMHAKMLAKENIISVDDAEKIDSGLQIIVDEINNGDFKFLDELEDIHMNIENRLTELIGEPAQRLHTARSRNDQVATDLRLWLRQKQNELDKKLKSLINALVKQAESGVHSVMPGFTHLQVAQPITWGHHMMAYVEMFARDLSRNRDARKRMNECPLGSAALAGTSFNIDRFSTASNLGFDRPTANSLDAVSDRDFVLEFMNTASITAIHLSRLAEEITLWASKQFQFVHLNDDFSTGSSIMPQKKNPDAAELIRAKSGRIVGSMVSFFIVMKGLPLAYCKDMQEDKEALFDVVDSIFLSIDTMESMLYCITINKENMAAAAKLGFSTSTDLADWLVKTKKMPFRQAHHITGALVKLAESQSKELSELTLQEAKSIHPDLNEDFFKVLDVHKSVKSRVSYGGTAPSEVEKQIEKWKAILK